MRRLKKMVLYLGSLYLVLVGLAYFFQERLIFLPVSLPTDHAFTFEQPYQEFFLTATDGAQLNAVHIKNNFSKGVTLYFHGNSGNISDLNHVADMVTKKGYDIILVDYRGFGKSTGERSEQTLNEDAQLFYNYAKERYAEHKIIVYGRSFGTGIVSRLASKNKPSRLILESPFYSAIDMGKYRFPFLPITWLAKFKFPSNEYLQNVSCPIYIFHGTKDKVIPYKFAQKLYESIPNDEKKMYTIENGGHKNLYDFETLTLGMEEALK